MAQPIDSPFLALIQHQFGDVLDQERFVLVKNWYDVDSFGDAVATYHSARLAIRFTRDKGIVFLDMGTKRTLFGLGQLVAFLDPKPAHLRPEPLMRESDDSTNAQLAAFRRVFDYYRPQLLDPILFTKRKHEIKRFIATHHAFPSGQRS